MANYVSLGWLLVVLGLTLAGAGLVWILAPSAPWLGRLPGDVRIEGGNYGFYFPVTTCLLLSLALSLLVWAARSLTVR